MAMQYVALPKFYGRRIIDCDRSSNVVGTRFHVVTRRELIGKLRATLFAESLYHFEIMGLFKFLRPSIIILAHCVGIACTDVGSSWGETQKRVSHKANHNTQQHVNNSQGFFLNSFVAEEINEEQFLSGSRLCWDLQIKFLPSSTCRRVEISVDLQHRNNGLPKESHFAPL